MFRPEFKAVKGALFELAEVRFAKLDAVVRSATGAYVAAGILDPDVPHGESTLGEVAEANEYGTKTIPARSFLRAPFEANVDQYLETVASATPAVLEGRETVTQVLDAIGEQMVADQRAAIDSVILPLNADSTLAHKAGDTPLIDTHALYDAMRYEVVQ